MNRYRISLALMVLALATLACNALGGSGNKIPAVSTEPANVPNGSSNTTTVKTDFPMTDDAYNANVSDGSLLYFTKMSQADLMKFYRDEYTAKGYKERELLTVTSDTTFSMVFDGDPSGKAVVIQSVDLGDGSRTVAIRLDDV